MNRAEIMDKASSILFFISFSVSKLRSISFTVFALANTSSLFFLFFGYIAWISACKLYPHHPPLSGHWFAFRQYKEQSQIAATFGAIAVVGCFIAISFPVLIAPSLWLFAISNGIWCISEFHLFKNPPPDKKKYSSTQQFNYVQYTAMVAGLSIFTAASITLAVIFPLYGPTLLGISALLGLQASLIAFNFWLDANINEHIPDTLVSESYDLMMTSELVRGKKIIPSPGLSSSLKSSSEMENFPPLFDITPQKLDDSEPPRPFETNTRPS